MLHTVTGANGDAHNLHLFTSVLESVSVFSVRFYNHADNLLHSVYINSYLSHVSSCLFYYSSAYHECLTIIGSMPFTFK